MKVSVKKSSYKRLAAAFEVVVLLLAGATSKGIGQTANQADKSTLTEIRIRPIDPQEAAKVSYTQQIKPLLENHCALCHSNVERTSDFDATTVPALLKKGAKAGPGVVPGKPVESAIVQYIRGVREPQMPKGLPPLSEDELHLIRMWIQAGARDDSKAIVASSDPEKASRPSPTRLNGKIVMALGRDQHAQKVLNALFFSESQEELMILRRNLRLSYLSSPPTPPQVSLPTYNAIDQFITAQWQTARLNAADHPPEVCDDITFMRRVYLDVIGVIPTIEDAHRFLGDPSRDKRAKLVDELLSRNGDYAAHWTPFWEEALGSATAPSGVVGGMPTRGNYQQWIYESLRDNKPYDLMVAELIDPTMPGHKRNARIQNKPRRSFQRVLHPQ